jgi:hypothetical protein
MQEFPCFWRTLRFGVKKQLAQRRDACSVSTDFVLLIFFLEEKPAQTKHMSLSIIIIYIYTVYIYFFSLSLSNVFFSRRRRLEFALVRVPIGPLTNRHFRAPSNRELDFGTFRQSKLAMGNFAAGFESILITCETWRLFRALVRVGR